MVNFSKNMFGNFFEFGHFKMSIFRFYNKEFFEKSHLFDFRP